MASEPQALNTDDAFPLQREYTLRPNEVLRRVPGAQRQHLLRWRDQGRITAKDSSIGKKKVSLYAESEIPTMRRLAGAIKGRFPATHEEFKTCDANRRAFEAVCRIARGRNSAANPVCIFGDAGVGKTHLLMAVEPFCWEWDPSRAVRYVSCRNASVPASGSFVSPAAAKVLSNCDILLIDDWDELPAQPEMACRNTHRIAGAQASAHNRRLSSRSEGGVGWKPSRVVIPWRVHSGGRRARFRNALPDHPAPC